MTDKRVVIVTGCSTGIGRESVQHLRDAGFLVVATARRVESIADLEKAGEVECLALDVTAAGQRGDVVAEVMRRHGRIDALVNNAGYGTMLALEDMPVEAMRAMFETNVFGLHDLTRRVLPIMRAQGSGRIVNVASVAGHIPVPLMASYCATKFAVRALTMALDVEVRGFGLRAILIEPGFVRTNFSNRATAELKATLPEWKASPYVAMYRRWGKRRAGDRGAHPSVIARRIVAACGQTRPRLHQFAPFHAKAANIAKRLLPDSALQWGMRSYFR